MTVKEMKEALEKMPENMDVFVCKLGDMPRQTEYLWKEKELGVVIIRVS